MSDAWIRARYGYGAARLQLCPDPGGFARPAPSLVAGLETLLAETRALGWRAPGRALVPLAVVSLALFLAFSLAAPPSLDTGDLEMVLLAPPPPPPPPLEEPPALPEPILAQTPLPPPPAPVRRARAAPPARPPSTHAQIAKAPPRERVAPPPQRPAPITIDPPVAMASLEPPAPTARIAPTLRAPARIPSGPPALLAIDALAAPSEPAAVASVARAERRETAGSPAPLRPSVAIDAVAADPARVAPAPAPARAEAVSSRGAVPRPASATHSSFAAARVAFAPAERVAARDVEPARGAMRVAFTSPPAKSAHSYAAAASELLEGVPLSSLAACMSDAAEDGLKLELMAALGARRECTSGAGRYRFVETKNLNAFLLWVERAPSRKQADRCVELALALECLRGRSHGRTREG